MREQLSQSIGLNERLIEQVGSQMKEIVEMQENIWSLEEQLREVIDKNDDFFLNEKSEVGTFSSIAGPVSNANASQNSLLSARNSFANPGAVSNSSITKQVTSKDFHDISSPAIFNNYNATSNTYQKSPSYL